MRRKTINTLLYALTILNIFLVVLAFSSFTLSRKSFSRSAQLSFKIDSLSEDLSNLKEENKNLSERVSALILQEGVVNSSTIIDHSIEASDVDSSEIQLRVDGACPIGEFVTKVNEDGSLSCSAPSVDKNLFRLSYILSNGEDAEGFSISNLTKLSSVRIFSGSVHSKIIDSPTIYTNSLCINNTCKESWTSLRTNLSFHSCYAGLASVKTCVIGSNPDFCSLSYIYPLASSWSCKVYEASSGSWNLHAESAKCSAVCFNLVSS